MEVRYYKEIMFIRAGGRLYEANHDLMFIAQGKSIYSIRKSGTMILHNNIDEVHITLRNRELLEPLKVKSFEVNGNTYETNSQSQMYHVYHGLLSLGFAVNYDGSLVYFQGATNVKK